MRKPKNINVLEENLEDPHMIMERTYKPHAYVGLDKFGPLSPVRILKLVSQVNLNNLSHVPDPTDPVTSQPTIHAWLLSVEMSGCHEILI